MKILSWNILMYIKKNQDLITKAQFIVDELKKIDADILMLQEASEYFISILSQQTDYIVHSHTLTHGGLSVILTKSKIKVEKINNFQSTGVGVKVGDTSFVTCHLVPGVKNQEFRQGQLKEITSCIRGEKLLIMGDMNMNSHQHFISCDMKDVAMMENNNEDTWYLSYHIKSNKTSRRFDRAYTNVPAKNFTVYKDYKHLSDHIPISVEL